MLIAEQKEKSCEYHLFLVSVMTSQKQDGCRCHEMFVNKEIDTRTYNLFLSSPKCFFKGRRFYSSIN